MTTIKSIEKEIAELEERQKSDQSKLNQLRKTKRKLIEQLEIEQEASNLKAIDELVESANRAANKHSVRFEKDEDLDAILISVNDEYISESIQIGYAEVERVSKALDLFVRNAEALSGICRDFNDVSFFRVYYDNENFEHIFIKFRLKEELIEIFLRSSDRISVTARVDLAYRGSCVLIRAGKLTYEVSMHDSYDSFDVDAFIGEECSIDQLHQTIDRLSKEIAKAKVIEED